jgi:hypothetical protein
VHDSFEGRYLFSGGIDGRGGGRLWVQVDAPSWPYAGHA